MSQGTLAIADSNGTTFLAALNAALARLATKGSGTARPSDIAVYEFWIDTSTPGTGIGTLYMWDGTADISWGTIDTGTHAWTPPAVSALLVPQGRLTLTTAVPVLSSAVTGATTIYYALYNGNQIPIWNGSAFTLKTFAELSNATAQSSTGKAGPAAVTTNSNYDYFVWNDAGTLRLTRGPAWTSDTARGTGAGTTELQRVLGLWTNKVDIVNGPGAGLGTYVGTIRTDGSSQVNWQPGAVASGGTAALLCVWNAYNRVDCRGFVGDSTTTWAYTTVTIRAANASSTLRVSFVRGLQEDFIEANYLSAFGNSSSGAAIVGVGFNSTTAFSGRQTIGTSGSSLQVQPSGDHRVQSLGFGYMQALEFAQATGAGTFYGSYGTFTMQTGLTYQGKF